MREENIFTAAAFLCTGALGLALISGFSAKLASLDRGLAQWALERGAAFDSGLVAALNFEQTVMSVVGILIWLVPFLFTLAQVPRSELRWNSPVLRAFLAFVVHSVVSMVIYLLLSQGIMGLMKVVFSRPRPSQTVQFSGKDNSEGCLVDFFQGYRVYRGPNPCGWKLHSCPSGHTQWVAAICLINVFAWKNCLRFARERLPRMTTARRVLFALTEAGFLFVLAASPVFTATVGLARISAKKHFFTDVTGSVCLSLSTASLLQLFRWHREEGSAGGEGDASGAQAAAPAELV